MDRNVKPPALALYLAPTSTGLSSRAKLWQRRHCITRSAPPKLGYVPTAPIDVLGRGSRASTPRQQQWLIPGPPIRPRVPAERVDMEDVLVCAETYRRSSAERHRLQVLEQVQRAVRHETLNTHEYECHPMAIAPADTVTKLAIDKWTQTEETLCDLPDRPTDLKADTEVILQQHNDPSATVVLRHIYPSNCDGTDCQASDCQRASKADEAPVTQADFRHRQTHMLVHNSNANISDSKDGRETKPAANENALVIGLTPQTKHMHSYNNNKPTGATCSLTLTSVATSNTEDDGTVTMNKKQVSFTREFTENRSKSSSSFLHHGQPSTPMFFTNLQHMQFKIATGQVDRKIYMNKRKQEPTRIGSVVPAGALSRLGLYFS